MVSPVKMTKKEKIKMYRTRSKKELAKMLYEANEQLSERGLQITFPQAEKSVKETICIKLTQEELERLEQQWWIFSKNCYIEVERTPEEK